MSNNTDNAPVTINDIEAATDLARWMVDAPNPKAAYEEYVEGVRNKRAPTLGDGHLYSLAMTLCSVISLARGDLAGVPVHGERQ